MRTNVWIPLIGLTFAITIGPPFDCSAAIIFSQDFSGAPSGPVSTYVNSSSPNSGQWNAVQVTTANNNTTVGINNGALNYTRTVATGVGGSFTRSSDFSPAPAALIYKFDLAVSGNSGAQTKAATWQVGDGFSSGVNSAESGYYSRFAINLTATSGTFQFRDIGADTDSANFSGSQSVTWIINNSGASLSYLAPNGNTVTVANDKWDLWAGSTLVFDERNAFLTSSSLTDLKFAFELGIGTVKMDNFVITAVPEPANMALGAFAVIFLATAASRARLKIPASRIFSRSGRPEL